MGHPSNRAPADRELESDPISANSIRHAFDLKQHRRTRGIDYVRAEYSSRNGQGSFNQVLFCEDDGCRTFVLDAVCTSQVKALFLAVLTARHPEWCRGQGACGDFRWRPEKNELTHSHYTLGEEVERVTHHGF